MPRFSLCKIVFATLLLSAPAPAAEPARRTLRMHYSEDPRAASCPGEGALREQVRRRTGYDPFRDDAPEAVDVAIAPRGAALVATLTYRDEDGRESAPRDFNVPSGDAACALLTSYVALSIAFTLTPFWRDEQVPATAPPPPELAPPPAPPRPRAPPARPLPATEPAGRRSAIRGGTGMFAQIGLTDQLVGGVSWFCEARWSDRLSVGLEVQDAFLPLSAGPSEGGWSLGASSAGRRSDGQPVHTRMLVTTALVPCLHTNDLLATCTVVELGVLTLAGQPGGQSGLLLVFVALGLRTGVELALNDRLSLSTHLELLTAVRLQKAPPPIDVLRAPHLSASVGAGVIAAF
ncbi:hypothetical protein WME98_43085 [Sorangium sp. So ce296]|uniref:hypothetical protein n=1 Tax=Sorangium sp. So ce296 TaxID=3133296 RepID=UPI003F6025D9